MAFSVGGKDVNRGGSGEIETERTKKAYGKNRKPLKFLEPPTRVELVTY